MGISKADSLKHPTPPNHVGDSSSVVKTRVQSSPEEIPANSLDEAVEAPNLPNVPYEQTSLGNDIRALRRARSMTLQDFADKLGRSVGFVSQLERGISEPSLIDLRNIATLFEVPLSLFFSENSPDPTEHGYVVRAGRRRVLGGDYGELREELLSPNLGGSFEILRCEFAPDTERSYTEPRDTEESGYLISGQLEVRIDGQWFKLNPGDSFASNRNFSGWRNQGPLPALVIWVISPPIY